MPVYTYRCNLCETIFEAKHSYKETLVVKSGCDNDCQLERVPSAFFTTQQHNSGEAVGYHVKKVIEETREDIREAGQNREDYK